LRQVLEAAQARQKAEQRSQLQVAEWQAKTICQFIGAQAMIDTSKTGGRNPLVDAAMAISIFGEKSPEELELERIRGPKVADSLEEDPRFAKIAADPEAGVEAANPTGSYEGFFRMFGGGGMPPPVPEDLALSGGES
jgi:hypothetical protein